jgi:hypothetical protein
MVENHTAAGISSEQALGMVELSFTSEDGLNVPPEKIRKILVEVQENWVHHPPVMFSGTKRISFYVSSKVGDQFDLESASKDLARRMSTIGFVPSSQSNSTRVTDCSGEKKPLSHTKACCKSTRHRAPLF